MQIQNILLYQIGKHKTEVSVYFEKGSFWLSQKAIALLFGVDRTVVTKHLKKIFESKELDENSVCAIFAHTAEDGKSYETKFYRL
ncbi:MAG TPA: cell filamentation protein Fic, partial [Saprospiraceae bacterium]|nr:cell filamentation protein Fic [Saprospiraceae bacterium]